MKDFPLPDEVGHDGGYVFDGDLRVLTMLVVDVDMVGLKTLKRGFDRLSDEVRPSIGNEGLIGLGRRHIELDAKLGADLDPVPEGL